MKDAKALEVMLARLDKDSSSPFSVDEANTFFSLQRKVTAQLVRARSKPGHEAELLYLDSLVKRAHNFLYPAKVDLFHEVKTLVKAGFAQNFRASIKLQIFSWVTLLFGFVIGFLLTHRDFEYAYMFVGLMYPHDYLRELILSSSARTEFLEAGRGAGTTAQTFFFTALFFNNFRAAISAFCVGIMFGFPTVIILLINGALLGSFSAIFNQQGLSTSFLAWVLPHAIPELAAVCIAAAGGLRLGIAVLRPNEHSRKVALAATSKDAVICLGLAALLLVYAAFIESFIRQSFAPDGVRFALVFINAIGLCAYLGLAGRAESS